MSVMEEQSLFIEALERDDPAARAAFLDEACGGNLSLRRRIERLLQRHQQPDSLLELPETSIALGLDVSSETESSGTVIGPYKLLEEIGDGGMGIVYLAEQAQPVRRRVALKVIKPGMDSKQVIARFEAERQALAMMDHPNIAKVYDAGSTDSGRPYFVMELVRGMPITQYCDRERLSIRDRIELFVLVCRAVQHAHQKGIIHRDLKPSNILVTVIDNAAVPKIIDFGIAKATSGPLTKRTVYTGFLQFVGTPPYMSPEQADLSGMDVDTRSDIYCLGVLLYELLTGSTPFDQETLRKAGLDEMRRIIREEEPPKPSTRLSKDEGRRMKDEPKHSSRHRFWPSSSFIHHSSSFQELDWIVMKALEKDRRRRYETANDFASDLMRYLADEPVQACPPSLGYRLSKYTRRHRAVLAMVSVVSLVLIAGATISTWQAIRATGAEKRMAAALEEAKQHRRLAERHLYATRLRFAHQALDSGLVDRAREILSALESEPESVAAGEFAWGYVRARAWDLLRPVGQEDQAGTYAVPSPDGRFLASFDADGPIHLIDGATLHHLATLPTPGPIQPPPEVQFSANGNRLVAIESNTVPGAARRAWIWEVPTGRLLLEFHPPPGRRTNWVSLHPGARLVSETTSLEGGHLRSDLWDVSRPAHQPKWIATLSDSLYWCESSADGRLLAESEPDRIVVHDALTGAEKHSLGKGTRDGLEWRVSFSRDGRTLVAKSRARVEFWDLATGNLAARRRLDGSINLDWVLAIPDGATLGIRKPEGILELWNRRTGQTRTIRPDAVPSRHGFLVQFSADGRKLAILRRVADRDRGPIQIWDVGTATLNETCTVDGLTSHGGTFMPDGCHLILTRSPVAQIWRFESSAPEVLAGHADEAWTVAFSPDGRILASGSDDTENDDTLKLWVPASGRLLKGWRAHPGTVAALSFSPDGGTLASASLSPSQNLRLWDAATGRLRATLAGHAERVRSVVFSPDGKLLASAGSDRTIRLWDGTSGKAIASFVGHTDTVREVAFSPSGDTLASVSNDKTVRLWDVATGRVRHIFRSARKCAAVAFAPDGHALAAADEGGDIVLWDQLTGARLATIHSDHEQLFTLAFSPDGRTLAAAGSSRVIHLWDVLTGQQLLALRGHAAQINALVFSPDGRTLASCSHDGAVKLWRSEAERRSRSAP
jgi:WD40 repeat protein/serine/threonine protein kinase